MNLFRPDTLELLTLCPSPQVIVLLKVWYATTTGTVAAESEAKVASVVTVVVKELGLER